MNEDKVRLGEHRGKSYDEVFHWIGAYININGYPPSVRDIAEGMGYKSTNTVQRILDILEYEGRISRIPNKSRTIVIREAL